MLYTKLLKFFAITTLTAAHSFHTVTAGSRHIPLHILEKYDALLASMDQYSSHNFTLAPVPEPIQEQMVSLNNQVSDVIHFSGCRTEKEPDSVCMYLFMPEEYLKKEYSHIVARVLDKEVKKARELIAAKIKAERKQKNWVLSWLHVRKHAKQ